MLRARHPEAMAYARIVMSLVARLLDDRTRALVRCVGCSRGFAEGELPPQIVVSKPTMAQEGDPVIAHALCRECSRAPNVLGHLVARYRKENPSDDLQVIGRGDLGFDEWRQ
jgi:hypothetical protein